MNQKLSLHGVSLGIGTLASLIATFGVQAAPATAFPGTRSFVIAAGAKTVTGNKSIAIAQGALKIMKYTQLKYAALWALAASSVILGARGVLVAAADTPAPHDRYELSWADEFDGPGLDTRSWHFRTDAKQRSVQLPENVRLEDGALVLTLKPLERPIRGMNASGAGVVSRSAWGHGYYEVRAKLGDGRDDNGDGRIDEGWHHAFWSMPTTVIDGEGVSTTNAAEQGGGIEIGGFENSSENLSRFRQHYFLRDRQGNNTRKLPGGNFDIVAEPQFDAAEWHVYGFEWTPDEVIFYLDGDITHQATIPEGAYVQQSINVWLSAICTNGNALSPEASEARYDYFRYYKAP